MQDLVAHNVRVKIVTLLGITYYGEATIYGYGKSICDEYFEVLDKNIGDIVENFVSDDNEKIPDSCILDYEILDYDFEWEEVEYDGYDDIDDCA